MEKQGESVVPAALLGAIWRPRSLLLQTGIFKLQATVYPDEEEVTLEMSYRTRGGEFGRFTTRRALSCVEMELAYNPRWAIEFHMDALEQVLESMVSKEFSEDTDANRASRRVDVTGQTETLGQ